jgi:serine protease AprX
MPPITINSNTIDPESAEPGYLPDDAAGTNFILLQTIHPLDRNESSLLNHYGVKIQQVQDNNNTYLCRYEPSDLKVLEALPFVRHALVYHTDFVIHPLLKDLDLENPPAYLKVENLGNEEKKSQGRYL